jgi:hypothetical protein
MGLNSFRVHRRIELTKYQSFEVYRNPPSSRGTGGSRYESLRIQTSKYLQGGEWKIAKEILVRWCWEEHVVRDHHFLDSQIEKYRSRSE